MAMLLLGGCTYDDLRAHERLRCERMMPTERERCLQRTQDTAAEYDKKREALKAPVKKDPREGETAESAPDSKIGIP